MSLPLAVILGAGPGIGLAVAARFAREGFRVALVSRPSDPLPAFLMEVEGSGLPGSGHPGSGVQALALAADLADPDQLAGALAAIEAWGGTPDVLVYNASAGTPGPAADLAPADLARDLQVNLSAPLAAARWALPAMREAGRGTLVFTGGGLALQPKPGMASACLGKAALRSLALSLGLELAAEGIHAGTVTVRGFVQPGTALDAPAVAEAFWAFHGQARADWTCELNVP